MADVTIAPTKTRLATNFRWAWTRPWEAAERLLSAPMAWLAAVASVLLLQLVLVVGHEAWADEWQAMLIALLSPDFGALLDNFHYEAHPPLWYLLLRMARPLGAPATILTTVQAIVAISTQVLLLTRLQLPRVERLAIALSYFLLIELNSPARSLGLGVLLIVAFFTLRSRPVRWLSVTLLPLVDFQFGLLSMVAVAILWREGDRSRLGLALWFVAGLAAAISVVPAPDMAATLRVTDYPQALIRSLSILSASLVPFHFYPGVMQWADFWPQPFGVVLGAGFVALAMRLLRHDRFERLLFLAFLGANVVFTVFVYALGVRHMTLVPLLLILLVAHGTAREGRESGAFRVWLAVIAAMGLIGAVTLLIRPFDTGRQTAELIRQSGLQDQNWIAWPEPLGLAVAGNLQRDMISIEKGCTFSFHRWNQPQQFRPERPGDDRRFAAALTSHVQRYGRTYVVSSLDLAAVLRFAPGRRIAHVPAGFDGYEFYLYEIAGDREPTGRPAACAPAYGSIRDLGQ